MTAEKARRLLKKKYGKAKSICLVIDSSVEVDFYRVDTNDRPSIKLLVTFMGDNETLIYSLKLEDIIKGKSIRRRSGGH
jgi:hypothetical protein